jgi:hypothetical protein
MKRGRRTAKNAEAFNAILRWEPTRREFLIGGAVYALNEFSTKTKVNPGTLSGIAAGHRFTVGYADRYKVIKEFPGAFAPGDAERNTWGAENRYF